MAKPAPTYQFLKLSDVLEKTSFSKSTLALRMKSDGFPRPVKLGLAGRPITSSTAARWLASEVDSWMGGKLQAGSGLNAARPISDADENRQIFPKLGNTPPNAFSAAAPLWNMKKLIAVFHANKTALARLAALHSWDEGEFLYQEAECMVDELLNWSASAHSAFELFKDGPDKWLEGVNVDGLPYYTHRPGIRPAPASIGES